MINPQWLELPMSRTNIHGPKDVRAIEVRLYNDQDLNLNCSDVLYMINSDTVSSDLWLDCLIHLIAMLSIPNRWKWIDKGNRHTDGVKPDQLKSNLVLYWLHCLIAVFSLQKVYTIIVILSRLHRCKNTPSRRNGNVWVDRMEKMSKK